MRRAVHMCTTVSAIFAVAATILNDDVLQLSRDSIDGIGERVPLHCFCFPKKGQSPRTTSSPSDGVNHTHLQFAFQLTSPNIRGNEGHSYCAPVDCERRRVGKRSECDRTHGPCTCKRNFRGPSIHSRRRRSGNSAYNPNDCLYSGHCLVWRARRRCALSWLVLQSLLQFHLKDTEIPSCISNYLFCVGQQLTRYLYGAGLPATVRDCSLYMGAQVPNDTALELDARKGILEKSQGRLPVTIGEGEKWEPDELDEPVSLAACIGQCTLARQCNYITYRVVTNSTGECVLVPCFCIPRHTFAHQTKPGTSREVGRRM